MVQHNIFLRSKSFRQGEFFIENEMGFENSHSSFYFIQKGTKPVKPIPSLKAFLSLANFIYFFRYSTNFVRTAATSARVAVPFGAM